MDKIKLGDHFDFKKIIRQCLSPILMMLFVSIYGIVDGIFISNFDSSDAFEGVNLIIPVLMVVGGTGFMLGSGGSALTSKLLGEKKFDEANKAFSQMIYFGFILGLAFATICFHFIDELVLFFASLADDSTPLMIEKATTYGRILIFGQPFFIIENLFQNFFVVDERPRLGFMFTFLAGITNIVFDALFIAVFSWGVAGAAIATVMGYAVGAIGPLIFFFTHRNDLIKIVKTRLDYKVIGQSCFNGLSDFIFNISANVVAIFYNIQLLKYFGKNGVNSYGIIMYTSFIFISVFIGFAIGMAPIIGYNYGSKNHAELKNVVRRMLIIFGVTGITAICIEHVFASPLASLFTKDEEFFNLAKHAMRIYSLSFVFAGLSIFITSMFTALNDGVISGIISFFRSLVFQILIIIFLPLIFGKESLWYAILIAEIISFILSFTLLLCNKRKYNY